MPLIDRLFAEVSKKQSPILLGLDPTLDRLPPQFHAQGAEGAAAALLDFNLELLEALADLVPAVKLQMACYELFGAPGYRAFGATVKRAKELGLLVVDDSKRGDIGSTAKLYAQGHLGPVPGFAGESFPVLSDFVTVNPYLGDDGLLPFYEVAQAQDKGVFVLVRTSNPSARQYQEAQIQGRPLFEQIALDLEAQSRTQVGACGYSPLGAVVGATWPQEAARLRELMPTVPFLVPGYGTQGGSGADVVPCFDAQGSGALVNNSRGLIFAYQSLGFPAALFAKAATEAALAMKEDLKSALKAQHKLPKGW